MQIYINIDFYLVLDSKYDVILPLFLSNNVLAFGTEL
jgi:hypothetical protein